MSGLDVINQLDDFDKDEFPSGVLDKLDGDLLIVLQRLRELWGNTIYPSTLEEGWVRTSGSKSSRHYAVNRKSDAGDIFPKGNTVQFWFMCQAFPEIGGIGWYMDTNRTDKQPGPMIHIDLREKRLLWSRIDGKYYYPMNSNNELQITLKTMSYYIEKEL